VMLAEMSKKEEEWGSEAYPLRRCTFYSPQKSGDSILCVGSPAVDRVLGEAPPSCLTTWDRRRPEAVRWFGQVLVVGWADPWIGAGLRAGKSLPIFFFYSFFSLCFIFCFVFLI
jgi:hypothetical protein